MLGNPFIDAHAHMAADGPEGAALLSELGVRVMNISLGLDTEGRWREASDFGAVAFAALARTQPKRFAWCTSFDLPTFRDADYTERVIAQLERDVSAGAVACKVWKNVGMEVRDERGEFVLIDHAILQPIFAYLERRAIPTVLHVGEPKACWLPLDERSPHYDYYREHPEWHMHGRTDVPSWEELLAARDRLLERHPRLRVVGAHLASIEHDLSELAARLERFPNLAVDSGGRLLDLALLEPSAVCSFFERFGDRILFGSDICLPRAHSEMSTDQRQRSLQEIRAAYALAEAFYGTDRVLECGRHTFRGLALPEPQTRRFFAENAKSWLNLAAPT